MQQDDTIIIIMSFYSPKMVCHLWHHQ